MSKLDELINELCPEGVVFRCVSDICNISRGRVMSKGYIRDNAGDYPVYSSQTENQGEFGRIATYDYEGEYLTWTTDGANAGSVFYRNGKFSVTNVCGLLDVVDDEIVSTRFLWYALSIEASKHVNAGMGNPKLMSNAMARIKIPVPPLKVQREIVQILDCFTLLTAELTAELTAREKQYEYYRNRILTFDDTVPRIKLGDACYIKARIGWQRLTKAEYLESGDYYLITGVDIKGSGIDLSKCWYVSKERYEMDTNIQLKNGDIIVTKDGTIGKVAMVDNLDKPAVLNSHLFVIRDTTQKIYNRFLMHILKSNLFSNFIEKNKTQGTIPGLNQATMVKFPIPVPPIEEQYRIADNLDRFDALCNDITIGIPAEIEARQKQYEYYRDKLLSFKELS